MATEKFEYDEKGNRYHQDVDANGRGYYYTLDQDGTRNYKGTLPKGETVVSGTEEDNATRIKLLEKLKDSRNNLFIAGEKAIRQNNEQINSQRELVGKLFANDHDPVTIQLGDQTFIDLDATATKFRQNPLFDALSGKSMLKDRLAVNKSISLEAENTPDWLKPYTAALDKEREKSTLDKEIINRQKEAPLLTKLDKIGRLINNVLQDAKQQLQPGDNLYSFMEIIKKTGELKGADGKFLINEAEVMQFLKLESELVNDLVNNLPAQGKKTWQEFISRWHKDTYDKKGDLVDMAFFLTVVAAWSGMVAYLANPDIVQIQKTPKVKFADAANLERSRDPKGKLTTRVEVNMSALSKLLMAGSTLPFSDQTEKRIEKTWEDVLKYLNLKGKVSFEFDDKANLENVDTDVRLAHEFEIYSNKLQVYYQKGMDTEVGGKELKGFGDLVDIGIASYKLNQPPKPGSGSTIAAIPPNKISRHAVGISGRARYFNALNVLPSLSTSYSHEKSYNAKELEYQTKSNGLDPATVGVAFDNHPPENEQPSPDKFHYGLAWSGKVNLLNQALTDIGFSTHLKKGIYSLSAQTNIHLETEKLQKSKVDSIEAALTIEPEKWMQLGGTFKFDGKSEQEIYEAGVTLKYTKGSFHIEPNVLMRFKNGSAENIKFGAKGGFNIDKLTSIYGGVEVINNFLQPKTEVQSSFKATYHLP